ncbi:uncharacterized protein LOC105286331 isoform X2 [Ooceraea biroi]|uniref:uncharacterized protein LOC105286331 isoform X2 n=1 Tax=Ooceraea biroi TaxID=2015173 RepID=UPI0005B7D904|nr:uncharacterized protein LOC105286331 isoform X2 [Ooceraea biroi]
MINPEDISEKELEALRGDAVGDSLCSNKWILNTLMSLCELHKDGWTQELEDRLCILWDLSVDKEITSHLVSCNFLEITKNILEIHDHSRLIEIILGIIGNVCCNDDKMIDTIGDDKDLVTLILNRLTSDDTRILIQLLRILQSILYRLEKNAASKWIAYLIEFEIFGDAITFILKSSTNNELLTIAVKLLRSICEINVEEKNFLEQLFNVDALILALLESFMQFISIEIDSYSTTELTFIKHWLGVLNATIMLDSFKFEDYEDNGIVAKVMDIIYRILRPYEHSYNLFPIRQLDIGVIQESSCILLNFHCGCKNFSPKVDHLLVTIMFSVKTGIQRYTHSDEKEVDSDEILDKLLNDLNQYWIQSIGFSTDEQVVDVLRLCEPELCRYLINIVQSDATTPEISEKVKRAVVAFEKS